MASKQTKKFFLIGCFILFVGIICCTMLVRCQDHRVRVFYIPEMELYVKIEKIPFQYGKLYFSKSKEFGTDFVLEEPTLEISNMNIYYVPPCTICVSGATKTNQDKLNIIEFKATEKCKLFKKNHKWKYEYYTEYTDSTFLKKEQYKFHIYSYFMGFWVTNPNGKIIFNSEGRP